MSAKMLRSKFRNEKSNRDSVLQKHNADFLLDNFLEPEVKAIILPLYLAECLTLAPKYSIRYDFITSNSYNFNASVCLCAAGIVSAWLYCILQSLLNFSGMLFAIMSIFVVSLTAAYIFNSVVTTSKSNTNSYLIILVQRIQKRFEFVNFDNESVAISNWAHLIGITAFNIVHFTFRVIESYSNVVRILLSHIIYIAIDCNSVIVARMIHLLSRLIETWILEFEGFCYANPSDIKSKDPRLKKIIATYDELIEALYIYNKYFGLQVFFFVVQSLFHVFFNVQYLILLPFWTKTMFISQTLWIKNIISLTMLCIESEHVYLKLKNAHVACIVLSTAERTADLASLLRRQSQQVEAARAGGWLRAGGLLPVDAALPLAFFSVLATYVVVLLQFHFL